MRDLAFGVTNEVVSGLPRISWNVRVSSIIGAALRERRNLLQTGDHLLQLFLFPADLVGEDFQAGEVLIIDDRDTLLAQHGLDNGVGRAGERQQRLIS